MRIFALALLFSLSVIAQVQVRYPQPYDEEILEIFNGERHLAGVVNLTWNAVLAEQAQDYANRCNSSLSAVKTYGEFVIRGFGVSETDAPKLMAALLVAEGRDWNCTTDVCISGACTHHRQIIWESTTEIGCGFAHCGTKGYQLVCRFLKVGNTYNVHPLAKTGCPKAETHKRTFGYGWGSGGLIASCLSGWGNAGWGGSGWGDSWDSSESSQPSGWGSSGSSQPSGWGSSGSSQPSGWGGSQPSGSSQPSGWGGSQPSGWGSSSSSSSGGWNGNGGWGNSQGGFRLSQTNTDQTALTNNELWAFWYSQGRNVIVDAGFVSHTDGTIIPVPGGSLKVISWEDQVLEVHNAERASYGLKPLVWDTALASAAQDYSSNCEVKLSGVRGIGESIAIGSGPVDKANVPKLIAALWSSEVFDWNCTTDVCLSGMCSHHRQMIWDETTKVGCGFSSCGTQGHILVCRYDTVGNLENRHPLASLGESACLPKHNNTAGKRTYGGFGGGGGCGGLLAACLNGYGAFSGWGSSGSSGSSGWGSASSGWGSSGSSQPSGWGSSGSSQPSGWDSSQSSQPSGWGNSQPSGWGSSSPSGWGSSGGSGWRVSESVASGTNSWGAALQSAASAVPSWWAQFQSVVQSVSDAAEAAGDALNQLENLTGVNAAAEAEAQQGQDAGNQAAGGSKKRGYGSTSNPSGSWGSSNTWGGHDSSQSSCAAPTAGWSNQPSSSSSNKGGWRCSAPSSSSWGGSSRGSSGGSSWGSSPSSNAWGSAASSSGWTSASDSCTAVQNSNSGWPGGNAGWGNVGSSSWSSGSSGWRVQKVETTTNEVTDAPSNNPVFQWWSIDGRSVQVDPGFRSASDGSIMVEGNGQPATGVQYIGALPRNTAIAVIVVCAICGLLLIALIVVFLVKKKKHAVESF